jgi:hypothetical protein
VLQVAVFLAWRWRKSRHFRSGGRSPDRRSTGIGGALSAVPPGVPVSSKPPGSMVWKRASRVSARARRTIGEVLLAGVDGGHDVS